MPPFRPADQGIHRAGGQADLRVLGQHIADQGGGRRADAQGVGHNDRRLDGAKLLHLHQTHGLAKAVDHGRSRHHLVPKQIAPVGQDGGDAGVDVLAVPQGHMTHPDARHIGDQIAGTGLALADPDAGFLIQTHDKSSFILYRL